MIKPIAEAEAEEENDADVVDDNDLQKSSLDLKCAWSNLSRLLPFFVYFSFSWWK